MKRNPELDALKMQLLNAQIETERLKQDSIKRARKVFKETVDQWKEN